MSETYNGWPNRETWTVNLYLRNDKTSSDHWKERAKEVGMPADPRGVRCNKLAKEMQESMEADFDDVTAGSIYRDLVTSALSKVDWYRISESWIDEARRDNGESIERSTIEN